MRVQKSAGDIKPEMEILLCCAQRALNPIEAARLRQISEGQIDWPLLFQLATENGLLPLLCEHLLQNSSAVPSEAMVQFRDANRRNALRGLFLTAELLRITESLRRRQIPALSYKGPVLGQLAYANPLLRQFDDLDIVVPQRFVPQVYEEMGTLGYEAKFSRGRFLTPGSKDIPGEYVFLHKLNGAMVEFHTEATLRHFPRPPDLEEMALRSTTVSLSGREVATFAPADALLMLCVHGAKDFWSRLIWVADIAALAEKVGDVDWERLFIGAKKYDAERMVRLGVWLANAIFEFELPAGILQNIEADRAAARIGGEIREQLLDRKELPAGVTWRSLYRIRMVPRIWKGTRYWLRLSTAPAEEDWSMTKNKRGFRASYALLRPLRLWRKYGHAPVSEDVSGKKN
ncbi:MAG: nucleotidyltransferase family protein [Candidatus Acidiferrales bacterium]